MYLYYTTAMALAVSKLVQQRKRPPVSRSYHARTPDSKLAAAVRTVNSPTCAMGGERQLTACDGNGNGGGVGGE